MGSHIVIDVSMFKIGKVFLIQSHVFGFKDGVITIPIRLRATMVMVYKFLGGLGFFFPFLA
jgi:hypothetical protein